MQKLKKSYFIGEGKGQLLYETIGSCFERVAKVIPPLLIEVRSSG
jgi:hypothetical protein